ncbi:MAG: hypothetical protein ACD_2C00130G0014 [uncultured bacterium (gcode 4)]|uniref:Uncharacterized protein n=1 Tax=uncultured bacterium (gcode 4) TaxID=1234023 RepID=K2G3A4_9BACT|nr:MAG: hypothetical protein ACD_2C00130G0014 [uncultured bacterium (gcode 4)]
MAEIRNEILDLSTDNGLKKLNTIFDFAKAKLQKVESKIWDFLRSHGFDKHLSKNYDGKLDKSSDTQSEIIFNKQILPLLNDFKRNRHVLSKKELIIKLSWIIEQAELQEKFSLSQSQGKDMSAMHTESRKQIENELLKWIDNEFHAKKLDVVTDQNFEKSKEAELKWMLLALSAWTLSSAQFESRYFAIIKETWKIGWMPMQARLLERFWSIAKPMMSSWAAPLLLMISKKTRKILPWLPLLIWGWIYASLFFTLRSKDISAWTKATEVSKTVWETILNIAPITGTIMSAKDTIHAFRRWDKADAIACWIGTLVSWVFDWFTIVLVASWVGIPWAVALSSVKNAVIRWVVKLWVKPLSKIVAKEAAEKIAAEAASQTWRQIIKEIWKSSTEFLVQNSKVAWKWMRHNTRKMILWKKEWWELVSRWLVHETMDWVKQIFTFKHARDLVMGKYHMRQYKKNPEALKSKNFKKYKEMEELAKEKDASIRSRSITESKIAEHNMSQNKELEDWVLKLNENDSESSVSGMVHDARYDSDMNKDLNSHLNAEFRSETDNLAKELDAKRHERKLKFESYIAAIESECTVKWTENIISKLDFEINGLIKDWVEIQNLESSFKRAWDWFRWTLDKIARWEKLNKWYRDPEYYANNLYKLKSWLELSRKLKADRFEKVEKLLDSLERRSYNNETTDHQKFFYSKVEEIIKNRQLWADVKKLILEHLTPQHINESLVKNNVLPKLIQEILSSNISITEKVDFLTFLKTEKNVNNIWRGQTLYKFAQDELNVIIKEIKGFGSEWASDAGILSFQENFREYDKLIRWFDHDLKMDLSAITGAVTAHFGKMEASAKVRTIGFLKRQNMLNYHLEDKTFSDQVLELIVKWMNDKTDTRSIRWALNMWSYLEWTKFSEVWQLYSRTLLNKNAWKGLESEWLWSTRDFKSMIRESVDDPRILALKHRNENEWNEKLFQKNTDIMWPNSGIKLLESITKEVLKWDTRSILGYLYEISKEPKTTFTMSAHNAVLKEFFQEIKNGKRSEEVVKFTKEICVYIKDQNEKMTLPFKEMQECILECLKASRKISMDEKVAFTKILELMPLSEKTYLSLGSTERAILAKRMMELIPNEGMEKNQTAINILDNLMTWKIDDPVDMMYKIAWLNYLQRNKHEYGKRFQSILSKRKIWEGWETIREMAERLMENKRSLLQELFALNQNQIGTGWKEKTLLWLDLEITKDWEFFLTQNWWWNRIEIDVWSKLNASYDYIELALTKSPIINSWEKENILIISKILEKYWNTWLLEKFEHAWSHVNLSNISEVLNNSKNLENMPQELIIKFLREFEAKPWDVELWDRFVSQMVIIRKFLKEKGKEEHYWRTIEYIEDLMSRKEVHLLDHQLSLIANLWVNKTVQKKAYKEFLNNRVNTAEELEGLLTHPLFKRIQDDAWVDFKYSNHNIAEIILKVLSAEKISAEQFNRLFILAELIKNKSVFYVETDWSKDTIKVLKEAFFKIADHKDPMSQSMIDKLFEIKELLKDRDVLNYFEARLKNAPSWSLEATTLMNRFFDWIYKHYKASSEIGFNVHDKAVFDRIQKAVTKHLLSLNIKWGKMTWEEFEKRLDLKTKELLYGNKIEIAWIENWKVIYRDSKTWEKLENLESIQLLRTEKIIKGIEKHLVIAVRAAMNENSEGKGWSDLNADILKKLSPNVIDELNNLKIEVKADIKLIEIAEFQSKFIRASSDTEKYRILNEYKERLWDHGVEIRAANKWWRISLQYLDSDGGAIDMTRLVGLVDKATWKNIESTSLAGNMNIIDSILSWSKAWLWWLRWIVWWSKELLDENLAWKEKIWHNVSRLAFNEVMSTKKAKIIIPLAITFWLMTAKQAQAMNQSVLDDAEIAAQDALKVNAEYQKAVKEGNLGLKKEIEEETIRKMTILKAQSLFNDMQMQVDRKIDEIVDKSLAKTNDIIVTPLQKDKIRELFKEEMYKYMIENNDTGTRFESPYENSKKSWLPAEKIISNALKWNELLENEIRDILNNINSRISTPIDNEWIRRLKFIIWSEFNSLK